VKFSGKIAFNQFIKTGNTKIGSNEKTLPYAMFLCSIEKSIWPGGKCKSCVENQEKSGTLVQVIFWTPRNMDTF